jgi:hypothetical protein
MRLLVLVFVLAIPSTAIADDLNPKGLILSPGNVLTDIQCWRVLETYSEMDASGRARIEQIASSCRHQLAGKDSPPMQQLNPPGGQASQAMQPMEPVAPPKPADPSYGGGNISQPMDPSR